MNNIIEIGNKKLNAEIIIDLELGNILNSVYTQPNNSTLPLNKTLHNINEGLKKKIFGNAGGEIYFLIKSKQVSSPVVVCVVFYSNTSKICVFFRKFPEKYDWHGGQFPRYFIIS